MFVNFNSYNNRPISIRTGVIIEVGTAADSTEQEPITKLTVTLGSATAEWFVRESVQSVLDKLNSCNPPK